MNQSSLLNHLAAYTKDEVAAKRRVLALLERHEASIAANDNDAFEAAAKELEQELGGNVGRARKRDRILGALGALWQVPPDALTLSSIAERAGNESAALRDLRSELRGLVADVLRRNRRLSSLIGMHRRVTQEIIEKLFDDRTENGLRGSGSLLNAEA